MPYTPYQRTDNGVSTVAGGSGGLGTPLNPSDTTLRLPTGDGAKYPATPPFMLYIGGSELAKATLRSSDTVTISRAQEGTSASTWPVGTSVELVETAGTLANTDTALQHLLSGVYNVRDYGAVGDGVTDDSVAIRAAFDACRSAGGGVVSFPAGTYIVSMISNGGSSGTLPVACVVGTNTTILGAGAGASIIKLAASQLNQGYVFHNYTTTGGDVDITVRGLTVDGNAANQAGTIDAQYGMRFVKCRRVRIEASTFKDVYGTTDGSILGPNGTAGEGFAQQFDNCADCLVLDSVAYATSANTSTGFASGNSTNIQRANCLSYGWGHGPGFTDWTSADIQHSNCRAYLCGAHGFNVELSTHAVYSGCISGGVATSSGAYPFTNSQVLGNTLDGFHALGSDQVQWVGCTSANNGRHGGATTSTPAGHVWVTGGVWTNNGGYGLLADANQNNRLAISGSVIISGNTSGAISTGGTPASMTVTTGIQTAPAVPATTVALGNPFHIPMLVNVIGGTVSAIALSGTTITGVTSGQVRLGASDSITLTYSVAPTWQWFGAL